MAWRCETFREIAPTHTTGRESTPGPQYRSQHPNQAHPPWPPHHPPPLTASSPPPGKSAPPTAPQAPRASLESPGARRFTLYRPPLEQGKVRPVTGSAGHWSWSGPLLRASTAAFVPSYTSPLRHPSRPSGRHAASVQDLPKYICWICPNGISLGETFSHYPLWPGMPRIRSSVNQAGPTEKAENVLRKRLVMFVPSEYSGLNSLLTCG